MIWKIIVAIVAVLIIAFIVFEIVSRVFAKKNLKAFLASHPQTPLTEEKKRLLYWSHLVLLSQ